MRGLIIAAIGWALAGGHALAAEATLPPPSHTFGPDISAEDFAQHLRVLASDEFEGRAPGSRGETLTLAYLEQQFRRLGLEPGNGDSYLQRVPMLQSTADPATTLEITYADGGESLAFGRDMVIGTSTGAAEVKLDASELVFVGYGVEAPEADWHDYRVDVRGKTVLVLVNDPGFHAGDEQLFQGRRMTYYGRWTYKFEEAVRQGAKAALIIHDTAGAGYDWSVVQNSWGGTQFDLPQSEDPGPRLAVQGWLSAAAAERLFARSGQSLDALRQAANRRDFRPLALNAKLSTTLRSRIETGQSHNVVARLPGRKRADEAIVYLAHWDHLGRNPALDGDQVFNGAIDNATGVAGLLEIAEAFVTQEPPPQRSLLFLATTLEESGLLGSKYFVAHPPQPLANMVAAINLDALQLPGRSRELTVVGLGNSELEDRLRRIAASQQRVLVGEAAPEQGQYYRSDHFNFAKAGVPALYAKSGLDLLDGGRSAGQAWSARYSRERYHQPGDEYDPAWDLSGIVDDLNALYRVGRELGSSRAWPNWYRSNEFRAARDASRRSADR